jgi:hypothetical protein
METIQINRQLNLLEGGLMAADGAGTSEEADFSEVEFTSGYGQVTSAGATVQKGVKGKLKISLKIKSYSEDSYKKVTDSITNTVTQEVREKLTESYRRQDHGSWWTGIFGIGSGHSTDYYRDSLKSTVNMTDTTVKKSLDEHMNNSSQEFVVEGEFEITGVSMVPTTVQLFIKTMQITVKNSKGTGAKTTTVLDNQIAAADEKGNVLPSSGKINIIPLA